MGHKIKFPEVIVFEPIREGFCEQCNGGFCQAWYDPDKEGYYKVIDKTCKLSKLYKQKTEYFFKKIRLKYDDDDKGSSNFKILMMDQERFNKKYFDILLEVKGESL